MNAKSVMKVITLILAAVETCNNEVEVASKLKKDTNKKYPYLVRGNFIMRFK